MSTSPTSRPLPSTTSGTPGASAGGLNRRSFLFGSGLGAVAAVAGGGLSAVLDGGGGSSWFVPLAAAAPAEDAARPVATGRLLFIFLRGGMDGLSAVVPLLDAAAYHAARPAIAVPETAALALDGRFGLHPALAPLHELYQAKELTVLHAIGNGTQTRSHFAAQAAVELGAGPSSGADTDTEPGGAAATGWITRHLAATRSPQDAPVRAVAMSTMTPVSLLGCASCLSTPALAGFGLGGSAKLLSAHGATLAALYGGDAAAGEQGRQALAGVSALSRLTGAARTTGTATLASQLDDAAALFGADVGVEVVTADFGGWDLHNDLGTPAEGAMHDQLDELATAVADFWAALRRSNVNDVQVVIMSEFGRRVAENGSGGLDHGRANAMLVLGRGHRGGGQTLVDWPGLAADRLDQGDLRATVDYRSVLAEIATRRMGSPDGAALFPAATLGAVGVA